jgi:hypothetical protein
VVYRGVVNPISISFAGIADKDVNASAQVWQSWKWKI